MHVLLKRRLESCQPKIAHYKNAYLSDYGSTVDASKLLVKTGGYIYDRDVLQTMSMWHKAMDRFEELEKTFQWISNLKQSYFEPCKPDDPWTRDIMDRAVCLHKLKTMDVMSDVYWITTLRHQMCQDTRRLIVAN